MDTNIYFKTHPTQKEVYQTSDGFLFAQESDAKNHAKTLKDKTVKKITASTAKAEGTVKSDGEKQPASAKK